MKTLTTLLAVSFILAMSSVAQALPVTAGLGSRYDASAITGLSDGDLVATWSDTSGNARDATGGFGRGLFNGHKYYSGVQNGLAAVRGDTYGGADIGEWFRIPSQTPRHLFFVATDHRPAGGQSGVMGNNSGVDWHNGAPGGMFATHSSKPANWIGKLDGVGINLISGGRPAQNQAFILSVEIPAAYTAATNRMSSDRDAYGYRTWGGDFFEVLLYDAPLSGAQELQVGTYRSDKWGITTDYPAIPEPATLSLVGLGALGMIVRRKRK